MSDPGGMISPTVIKFKYKGKVCMEIHDNSLLFRHKTHNPVSLKHVTDKTGWIYTGIHFHRNSENNVSGWNDQYFCKGVLKNRLSVLGTVILQCLIIIN